MTSLQELVVVFTLCQLNDQGECSRGHLYRALVGCGDIGAIIHTLGEVYCMQDLLVIMCHTDNVNWILSQGFVSTWSEVFIF